MGILWVNSEVVAIFTLLSFIESILSSLNFDHKLIVSGFSFNHYRTIRLSSLFSMPDRVDFENDLAFLGSQLDISNQHWDLYHRNTLFHT